MFKNLANFASVMRQATQIGGRMQEVQDELREERLTGAAGGGMVEVEANGHGEVLRLSIDPELFQRGDREMIEDLIPAAVNQAQAKAKQLHLEKMQEVTGGLDVPGLEQALSQFTGKGS
jgi:DNA-binding YbaB/EbfC family protein